MSANDSAGMPVRLLRGDASPEEIAAILAILALTGGDGDGPQEPADRETPSSVRDPAPWRSPRRMVRVRHHHGPDGWRASALPR